MHYLITGGTGFIGRNLCTFLLKKGHTVAVLTRNVKTAHKILPPTVPCVESLQQLPTVPAVEIIVNLAGQSLASHRWTTHFKKILIDSRVNTTQNILHYIEKAPSKPRLLVSGSAIGFYGPKGDENLLENSLPTPSFTHDLCAKWEKTAEQATHLGVRVCLLRIGLVLGKNGGMLQGILPTFKWGFGGPWGQGVQWMSWIHLLDLLHIILYLSEHEPLQGPVNATAPYPVQNQEFASILASILHRPSLLKMPAPLLRSILGGMAEELLLSGQRVIPQKLLESGYIFQFPHLKAALKQILNHPGTPL